MTYTHSQPTESSHVIEVYEHNFESQVLARSREVPVVIDFWAPWCGPCRVLGPTLERLAGEANGAWVLAKINVDENPSLASAFRVQGIPAVKAVRDGRVVDEFTGALPESQVRAWLKRVAPARADQLIEEAASLEATAPQQAIERYRAALQIDPVNAGALAGLGRLLLLSGDMSGRDLLRSIPEGSPQYAAAHAALELADLLAAAEGDPAGAESESEARYRTAAQHLRRGEYAAAIEHLLAIVQRDRTFHQDGARKALLALFAALGDTHPLTIDGRRKLANALF